MGLSTGRLAGLFLYLGPTGLGNRPQMLGNRQSDMILGDCVALGIMLHSGLCCIRDYVEFGIMQHSVFSYLWLFRIIHIHYSMSFCILSGYPYFLSVLLYI